MAKLWQFLFCFENIEVELKAGAGRQLTSLGGAFDHGGSPDLELTPISRFSTRQPCFQSSSWRWKPSRHFFFTKDQGAYKETFRDIYDWFYDTKQRMLLLKEEGSRYVKKNWLYNAMLLALVVLSLNAFSILHSSMHQKLLAQWRRWD